MRRFFTDLQQTFRKGNIFIRLIFINAAVFVTTTLVQVFMRLFRLPEAGTFFSWLELPASFETWARQPWTLLTYMFVHAGILHILFNMLWLYAFGRLFLYFFSGKHLRGLYILAGIFGGLFYMAAYNVFPFFADAVHHSMLVGASASVLGIVAAAAYREPNYRVQLLLFGSVRLRNLALVVILTDLLFITSENGGGHIAHLGGAVAGLCFAAGLSRGIDLTAWINCPIDFIAGIFHRLSAPRKPKMKVHYGNSKRESDYAYNARKKASSEEIDRILDKLKKSGYDSLTDEEKKSLFDASKR